MRTLGLFLLAIHGVVLAAAYSQYARPVTLALCVVLFILGASLVWVQTFAAYGALLALSMAAAGAAAYGLATGRLWLSSGAGIAAGLAVAALVMGLAGMAHSRMQRVFFNELMVIGYRLNGGFATVSGPAWVLPVPGVSQPLALLPRYEQEHELTITKINTRPRPGALGDISQNISTMAVELVYELIPAQAFHAFSTHNQDAFFAAAARLVRRPMPQAMLDKQFWVEVWRLAMADIAERVVRTVVHRANMTALEVSHRRDVLEADIARLLAAEAAAIGLRLLGCTIMRVEPDEAGASLASRELAMTGGAEALTRAAMLREMVAALRSSGNQVTPEMIELIIQGALPHPILSAYLRNLSGRP
jgi:hypothetical protein